jgi:hypothetical protein
MASIENSEEIIFPEGLRKKKTEFKNVLVRIPVSVLYLIDTEIEEKPWMKRNQWIVEAIVEKLKASYTSEEG